MSSINLINTQYLEDFDNYSVIYQQIKAAIIEEMNISNGDFITLTPQQGIDLAGNAARKFLNKLKSDAHR